MKHCYVNEWILNWIMHKRKKIQMYWLKSTLAPSKLTSCHVPLNYVFAKLSSWDISGIVLIVSFPIHLKKKYHSYSCQKWVNLIAHQRQCQNQCEQFDKNLWKFSLLKLVTMSDISYCKVWIFKKFKSLLFSYPEDGCWNQLHHFDCDCWVTFVGKIRI